MRYDNELFLLLLAVFVIIGGVLLLTLLFLALVQMDGFTVKALVLPQWARTAEGRNIVDVKND